MKITFHGAARTVTGSKHLITLKYGKNILLDCGMFQGMGKETDALNRHFGFDPKAIDCLILSHAHIDHSRLIPKLVSDGFKGKYIVHPQHESSLLFYWLTLPAYRKTISSTTIKKERQLDSRFLSRCILWMRLKLR
jgi:Cft2 family RNA processing exonuclease